MGKRYYKVYRDKLQDFLDKVSQEQAINNWYVNVRVIDKGEADCVTVVVG